MRAAKVETKIRREQIIEKALGLIGEEGIAALSIAGIAKRVGIVPSALYRHFRSKDAVLDAVLAFIEDRLFGNITEVRAETSSALSRLKSLLLRHARMVSEYRAIPLIVFSDGIYAGHPERKSKISAFITGYLRGIEKIIEEGKQDGSIRGDVVASTASVLFLGIILPAAVLWNVSGGNFDMDAHVKNAWPVFIRSIAPDA
ncbi:MAG: TetR/AcrR family transcriptional regulator [Lentisphaeria bacterium]